MHQHQTYRGWTRMFTGCARPCAASLLPLFYADEPFTRTRNTMPGFPRKTRSICQIHSWELKLHEAITLCVCSAPDRRGCTASERWSRAHEHGLQTHVSTTCAVYGTGAGRLRPLLPLFPAQRERRNKSWQVATRSVGRAVGSCADAT